MIPPISRHFSKEKVKIAQASLICGSVVAPFGEKARRLEKDKASEGLEPLSTETCKGSTEAATCSIAIDLLSIE